MNRLQLSSGDLLADRRADYAEKLAASGEHSAAAELMRDALALAPAWAAGWFRLGELLQAADRLGDAIDTWREALRLDPADRLGAALKLELTGAVGAGAASSGFAETLFDQYAETFDADLVERLGYRIPELLADAIGRSGTTSFAHAVDLGCGTGLMGERLRGMVSFLEGSDISRGMLAKARAKGVYDRLEQADLQALQPKATPVDLVTAADVFIYLGGLERVLAAAAKMLSPGGVLAFSTERHVGTEPFVLRESRRYAHSEIHLRDTLAEAGFELLSMETETLRLDRGEPVEGLIVVAVRITTASAATIALVPERDEAEQPMLS